MNRMLQGNFSLFASFSTFGFIGHKMFKETKERQEIITSTMANSSTINGLTIASYTRPPKVWQKVAEL